MNPTLPNFIAMRGAETYKTMMHQQAAAASFGYPGSAAGAAVGSVGGVGHGGVGYNTTSASEYAQQYLPNLRLEIMKLLPIPASTSLSEGKFSVANQIRSAKRSLITGKNLNYFLTCHYSRLLCPQNYTS